ncbi:Plexin repeat [Geosmithia morbida]|uniref:Plexin repeat n=1 Tax=Geosmithia morbida TaxID=1094350 RepID=A0A9P4YRE3_9HYPO|nr:Plexin repeat [Geosmithia morbida]KAF4121365.1 Plexin repeat [Geosmithia morbida]
MGLVFISVHATLLIIAYDEKSGRIRGVYAECEFTRGDALCLVMALDGHPTDESTSTSTGTGTGTGPFSGNFTLADHERDELLRCWGHASCDSCLEISKCSWCPYTWSCVPNSHLVPFLAPAYQKGICPASTEQWELRTQPLGCNVSSVNTISVLVAVAATLVVVALIGLTVLATARVRRHLRDRRWQPWWPEWDPQERQDGGETDPLLSQR